MSAAARVVLAIPNVKTHLPRFYPSDLGALSALLKQHGYDTRIFALDVMSGSGLAKGLDRFTRLLRSYEPDVVGISSIYSQVHYASLMARCVRQHDPHVPVIIGGKQATLHPESLVARPEFDAVCVGEGEGALLDFVRAVESGDDFRSIPNIWCRADHGSHRAPGPAVRVHGLEETSDLVVEPDPTDGADHCWIATLEVTRRCDRSCPACDRPCPAVPPPDPSLEQLLDTIERLRGRALVLRLDGGEPTLRDDLPELIAAGRRAGFLQVEIATHGLDLLPPGRLERLVDAGLETLYLQFDGLTADAYRVLRGEDLLDDKLRLLDRCREAGLANVALAATLAPGVNDDQVGELIRFAVAEHDLVRAVCFHPVTARHSNPRLTIEDVKAAAEEQTGGVLRRQDWLPLTAATPVAWALHAALDVARIEHGSHPACGAASVVVADGDGFLPIGEYVDVERMLSYLAGEPLKGPASGRRARLTRAALAAVRSLRPRGVRALAASQLARLGGSGSGLARREVLVMTMRFQDAHDLDRARLDACTLRCAMPDGRLVSRCERNVLMDPREQE